MMKNTYRQLSALNDNDLIDVFSEAKKIMQERGICNGVRNNTFGIQNITDMTTDEYFEQDWSDLFNAKYSQEEHYYVYFHVDPRIKRFNALGLAGVGMPFYVGKGTASRYFCKRRSKPHLRIINEIMSDGYDMGDIAHIYKSGINERDAFILESKCINFFGCRAEMPKLLRPWMTGHKKGLLVNTDTGVRPKWIEGKLRQLIYTPQKAREYKELKRSIN